MSTIKINPKHKGYLHEAMGIAKGKKIPGNRLKKVIVRAKRSGDVKEEREAVFAENAKHWKKR